MIFFFAGFDSVSTLMCFLAYELCVDQDIQNRLREEIEETSENCNNKLTYEALVGMKYMDMVVTGKKETVSNTAMNVQYLYFLFSTILSVCVLNYIMHLYNYHLWLWSSSILMQTRLKEHAGSN